MVVIAEMVVSGGDGSDGAAGGGSGSDGSGDGGEGIPDRDSKAAKTQWWENLRLTRGVRRELGDRVSSQIMEDPLIPT